MLRTKRSHRASPPLAAALAGAAFLILVYGGGSAADDCFEGEKAFAHLRALVEIGPRPAGSPEAARAQEYILNELARLGLETWEQDFVADTPLGSTEMKNIIALIPGDIRDIIIIGAHYDTKLFEDFAFVGANDGGSGTAVLLELARCLSTRENEPTIWLALFDGEEAFVRWSSRDSLYGSRHMARELSRLGDLATVKALIVLDMVGDTHLSIEWESNSTPWLKEIVWSSADKLNYGQHFTRNACRISDDHVPFLDYGIPSIDIIDFHYGPKSLTNEYWHTPDDTLDKTSSVSLKIIGDVVLESLPAINDRVNRTAPGSSASRYQALPTMDLGND